MPLPGANQLPRERHISYTLNGATITFRFRPATISVQPNPELYLKYFCSATFLPTIPTASN